MKNRKLRVIDLFAWIWWLSYWFYHNEDFEVVAANELLPNMCKTYELNHPWVKLYCGDIKDFWIKNIQEDFWYKKGDIDIIVGWPPCQAYSTVGKRLMDDPRWKLFQEYYRILKEFSPNFFIFENVKWLLSMDWWNLIKNIVELFESLWYDVKYKLVNAADYWVPQLRERVIVTWAKRKWIFQYPEATHYDPIKNTLPIGNKKPHITLKEAIWDLPSLTSWWAKTKYEKASLTPYQIKIRNGATELIDHDAPVNNENMIWLMKALPEWWSPADLPEHLNHLKPTSWFWNTYCRLWWDRPGMTVTRNLWTPSSSRCIHPSDARPLSTREWARIQSFPDTFVFYGNRWTKNLQIWNAVPPVLSTHLAQSVLKYFQKN